MYNKFGNIYNECLEQMCRENNIMFIPISRYLTGWANYFFDICHLTPQGMEKKADAIFIYLKEYLEQNRLF
jgi:hypothetical protein